MLKQIQALCNQWNNKVDTIQQPIRATNTAPARHSLPATRVANSKLIKSHQEHLRLMDQNTQDQTCLVCHTPIDFRRQSKNSKICLTCRDKGLSRMRWCIDCNQLKVSFFLFKFQYMKDRIKELNYSINKAGDVVKNVIESTWEWL